MSTISLRKSKENKEEVHRGIKWMKNLCESLREHAMEIINWKNKVINKKAAGIK